MLRRSKPSDHSRAASTRRRVAGGEDVAQVIADSADPAAGPREQWRELMQVQAARLGMPPGLLALLREPDVTDVLVSGRRVWADRGAGVHPVALELGEDPDGRRLAVRLAAAAGKRLDDASPIVDGVLGDRFRVHAVLPPVAHGGASISIRVARRKPFSLAELQALGSMSEQLANQLRALIAQSKSLLISGGTGSGKTTLLGSLLGLVPHSERIICIEEVSELAVEHPHLIRLQARSPNVEGEGGVGLDDLVRAAVRMRPDRVVLGECRGSEVREVLTAMNTGHRGSCATIHANSIEDVPARLIALGALGGLSPTAVAALAVPAFDAVVHLSRGADGRRRVESVGELRLTGDRLSGVVVEERRAS